MAEDDNDISDTMESRLEAKSEFADPRLAICEACLKRTIPTPVFEKLLADTFSIVLVEVPGADWVDWVGAAVKEMLPKYPLLIRSSSRNRRASGADLDRLVTLVATEGGAIVILESGDIPKEIERMADFRFRLILPDLSALREVARRTLVGNAARIKSVPSRASLGTLAACFPPGAPVATAIRRLRKLIGPATPPVSDIPDLDSVQGLDEAKLWGMDLKTDLAAFRAGEIPFSAIEAGAVLTGPPGTGKTMVARIIAKACGLAFVPTSIATLFATSDGDLDGVIKKFRSAFEEAKASAPSLLFIDELDALPSRDTIDNHGRSWWTPLITDFLLQLDSSLNDRSGVIVVGATNRYQDLDPALVRPGRLSKRLQIDPPSTDALEGILRHYLKDDLAADDLRPLAVLTTGATGAAAAEWVNAARRAARNAGRALRLDDLWDAAIGTESRSVAERWRVAVHEAGHCVLGYLLGRKPVFVTVRMVGHSSGHTRFDDGPNLTRSDLERAAVVMLGGQAAERTILGDNAMGAGGNRGSDLHLATEVVAQGHACFGWGDAMVWRTEPKNAVQLLSRDPRLFEMVEGDLRKHAETAKSLIEQHADTCRRFADLLMSRLSLSKDELDEFFRHIPSWPNRKD
ncbi:AAA family ATPase [Pelagibacterium sp. H642]|uniref:AAA family ATPase n=1 Tax=Pelagibacterium sp. H642 TaxID=1881069 RepID=UPI002814AF28|nr:AAA family ATPase [Pelagibacterium sp. H642]WMT91905.1 AAA family ATPase [Pelagibacterium sp. H642]